MRLETSRFSGAHGTELPYMIWAPETMPCMVLQITHGMTEHIGRYTALAKELAPSRIAVNALACGVIDTDILNIFCDFYHFIRYFIATIFCIERSAARRTSSSKITSGNSLSKHARIFSSVTIFI